MSYDAAMKRLKNAQARHKSLQSGATAEAVANAQAAVNAIISSAKPGSFAYQFANHDTKTRKSQPTTGQQLGSTSDDRQVNTNYIIDPVHPDRVKALDQLKDEVRFHLDHAAKMMNRGNIGARDKHMAAVKDKNERIRKIEAAHAASRTAVGFTPPRYEKNNAPTIDHEYDSAVVKAMDEGRSRNAAHMHVVRALGRKRGETPTTSQPIGGLQSNNATPAKQLGKNRLAAVGKLMSKGSPSMTAPLTPGERAINKVHAQTGEHRSTIAYKAESAYRDRVSSIASLRSQSEAKAKADAAKPTTGKLLGQAPSASTGGEVTVKAHTDSKGKHYKEFTRKKAQR